MRDFFPAEVSYAFLVQIRVVFLLNPSADLFPVSLVGHAENLNVHHIRMRSQVGLDLSRIQIGSASNYHVLITTLEIQVAFGVHRRNVSCLEPAILIEGLVRLGLILQILFDYVRALQIQLTIDAQRLNPTGFGFHNLAL